ncbi:hypothetical protein [Chitinophaga sp.]|uniref:hypothetical protein n=1 Tax=Chitinophaga sp. TaxID=1869181 RepID=UPI0031DCC1A4
MRGCPYLVLDEPFSHFVPGSQISNILKLAGGAKIYLFRLPGFELEWFYFMNTIYQLKEVKKTQVIQYNFTEQTTGIDILHKLKKRIYLGKSGPRR